MPNTQDSFQGGSQKAYTQNAIPVELIEGESLSLTTLPNTNCGQGGLQRA